MTTAANADREYLARLRSDPLYRGRILPAAHGCLAWFIPLLVCTVLGALVGFLRLSADATRDQIRDGLLAGVFIGGIIGLFSAYVFIEAILPSFLRLPDLQWLDNLPEQARLRYLEFMTRPGSIHDSIRNPRLRFTFAEWPDLSLDIIQSLARSLSVRTVVEHGREREVVFRVDHMARASYHDFHNWLHEVLMSVILPIREHGYALHEASFDGEPIDDPLKRTLKRV